MIATRDVLDVPLALVDYDSATDRIDEMVATGERGYVCVAAVHVVMAAQHDRPTLDALHGASMVVPDGRPLVWVLNHLGEHLPDRVYGPELMRRQCERSARSGQRIFLFGGHSPEALQTLEHALRRDFPSIEIAGSWRPPSSSLDDLLGDSIAQRINSAKPDIVWIGLGAPRQEQWMAGMRERLDAPVLVGVGAAFDFLAGLKSQAPLWMQRRGLEWAFRLAQEPRRLAPRYLRYNPAFVAAATRQIVRERRAH